MRARSVRTVVAVLGLALAGLAVWLLSSRTGGAPAPARPADRAAAADSKAGPVLEAPAPRPPGEGPVATVPAWARGVVLGPDERPVAGARVLARHFRESGGRRVEWMLLLESPTLATTDAAGRFRIARPPADLAALVFLADGFASAQRTGLSPAPGATHELMIRLATGRRLVGAVRDAEGRPIQGARVGLIGAPDGTGSPSQNTVTDETGSYAFASLPMLLERGIVTASGYLGSEGFLDASAWGERKDFTLARGALLVDAVEADGKAPVPGARGTLWAGTPTERWGLLEPWRYRAHADFPDRPGRLELWLEWYLSRLGDQPVEGEVVVFAEGHRTTRVRLTLKKGDEPPHLVVALARGEDEPSLAGAVVAGEGAKITVLLAAPKLSLSTTDDELPALRTLTAGAGGRFVVRGLPSDRYRLRAERADGATVTVDATAPALELVLAFPVTGRLEVRVVSAEGTPKVDAEVGVEPVEGRTVLAGRTGADGVASFDAVPVGRAHVAPRHSGSLGAAAQHPCHVIVAVEAGVTARADVLLPARVRQVVRVLDECERPVEGVTVRLEGMGFGGGEDEWERVKALALVTDTEGRVEAELYPGGYRCVLTLASGARQESRFQVPPRPGLEQVVHVVRAGVTLRGRVLEEGTDGPVVARPVFVYRVALEGSRDKLGTALTDDEGRFAIAGLPAERVRLTLALRGQGERGASDADSPWPSAVVELDLATPPAEFVARVPRVQGSGAIERTVTLAFRATSAQGGAPLDGASAYAQVLRNGLWIGAGEVTANETGRGEGRLVPGERYRVFVSARWSPKPPRWKGRQIDAAPVAGRVEVEAALEQGEG